MTIEVKQLVNVIEKDGKETPYNCKMSVNSHEDDDELVVLVFEGREIVVCGDELVKAVQNAMNVT